MSHTMPRRYIALLNQSRMLKDREQSIRSEAQLSAHLAVSVPTCRDGEKVPFFVLFCRFSSAMSRTPLVLWCTLIFEIRVWKATNCLLDERVYMSFRHATGCQVYGLSPHHTAAPESRQAPRSTWIASRCRGDHHLIGYRWLWVVIGNTAGFFWNLKWSAHHGIFPMTSYMTRPWFMMALICGALNEEDWLATGALFLGILRRLASPCRRDNHQRKQHRWISFRESIVLILLSLQICLDIYIFLFIYLSIYLSICLSVCPSIYHLFIHLLSYVCVC